jgi:hypothetical protein
MQSPSNNTSEPQPVRESAIAETVRLLRQARVTAASVREQAAAKGITVTPALAQVIERLAAEAG